MDHRPQGPTRVSENVTLQGPPSPWLARSVATPLHGKAVVQDLKLSDICHGAQIPNTWQLWGSAGSPEQAVGDEPSPNIAKPPSAPTWSSESAGAELQSPDSGVTWGDHVPDHSHPPASPKPVSPASAEPAPPEGDEQPPTAKMVRALARRYVQRDPMNLIILNRPSQRRRCPHQQRRTRTWSPKPVPIGTGIRCNRPGTSRSGPPRRSSHYSSNTRATNPL